MKSAMLANNRPKSVAISCGGSGGHLFPGLAVGEELRQLDCEVTLLISSKGIDQKAVGGISAMQVVTLSAVGLTRNEPFGFLWGTWKSYRQAKRHLTQRGVQVVMGMGGFTSAPCVLAGKSLGMRIFLHESNAIPGRANRWLAKFVERAFVHFPEVAGQLSAKRVEVVGMPIRRQFLDPMPIGAARLALGLVVNAPVLLVMGGSQGAKGINRLVLETLPWLRKAVPDLQFLHLTGADDFERVRGVYAKEKCPAVVHPFLREMGMALAAADIAVSRAGASSLAELAARKVPAILIPYPSATDNHQYFNARAFVMCGAGRMVQQGTAKAQSLAKEILDLFQDLHERKSMQKALQQWHTPNAAMDIAKEIAVWLA